MVEHDLAKVGVASSNLVSRSIVIFLCFSSFLFSQTIYIDKTYCVDQSDVRASFFGYKDAHSKDDPVLVEIPKDRMQYTVMSGAILSFFNDRNISVVDTSEGVVVFKKECRLMGKADAIEALFLKKFQAAAPYVLIESKPHIGTKASLPADFKRYELIDILLSDNTLRKNSGSFVALFKVGDKERKLYFSYEMDAKARVFKAKRNLLNGTILGNDDFETVLVGLDALPNRAMLRENTQTLMVKSTVKEGQILTDYLFEPKRLVTKKSAIKALYKDESLSIEVQATLLDDGDVGDIVRIKTEQGKILNAKIVSANEAVILE